MGKVTVIIGEPATGKSTIMKKIITNHGYWKYDPTIKYIPCHWQSPDMCIIGRYDDMTHQFPGTDRMSMACQPHVLRFMDENPNVNFVLEGDRLGNSSFLGAIAEMQYDLNVLYVHANPATMEARRLKERADQSHTFIKSRQTKIDNILRFCRQSGIKVIPFLSNNPDDAQFIAEDLYAQRLQH